MLISNAIELKNGGLCVFSNDPNSFTTLTEATNIDVFHLNNLFSWT